MDTSNSNTTNDATTVAGLNEEALKAPEPPYVIGTSGTRYDAVNILKLTTRHIVAVARTIAPFLPLAAVAIAYAKRESTVAGEIADTQAAARQQGRELTEAEIEQIRAIGPAEFAEMVKGVDLMPMFTHLLDTCGHLQLMALLYLSIGTQKWTVDYDITAAMEDFGDLPITDTFEAFRRFFTYATSFSPRGFRVASEAVMTMAKTMIPNG